MVSNLDPARTDAQLGSRPRRVAMLVLRNDAMDGRLLRQSSALRRAGYAVEIFPILTHNNPISTGQVTRRVLQPIAYRLRKRLLFKMLNDFAPDLILAHEPEALDVAAAYLDGIDLPLIYDAHEFYEEQVLATQDRIAWLRKTYARASDKMNALITVSPGLKRLYADHYPCFPSATLIYNAPEAKSLGPYDGRLHNALSLSRDTKILLYQGRVSVGRGLLDVALASKYLPENWVTVFMGYGQLHSAIPDMKRLYTMDAVPNDELHNWTRGANLGLIPYPASTANHIYCLPNKLWEYPLAGVPVLSNNLVDISTVLEKWEIGVTYRRDGQGVALAKAVTDIRDEDLLAMQSNCTTFAATENWGEYQKEFLNIVALLL